MTQIDRINGLIGSIAVKAPVRSTTTANITLSGLQTIDGVTLAVDDRILVKDQTAGAENGIYVVSSSDWSRAPDWDGERDITEGTVVFAQEGTAGGDHYYHLDTSDPITIGTTAITFTSSQIPFQSALDAETAQAAAEAAQTAAEAAQTAAEAAQTAAETAQTNAETAETNAETAETNAATSYDNFDDRYLGQKASDPALDNDGQALLTGALYFNTTNNIMRVYNGASWQDATALSNTVVDNYVTVTDYTAGTTTQLTLGASPASENSVIVSFDGVNQHKSTFTLAGAVITFSSAIPVGTAEVEIVSLIAVDQGTVADNSITTAKIQDDAVTGDKIDYSTFQFRKNLIINGNPSLSRRGDYTSATAASHATYYIDWWQAYVTGVTCTVQTLTASQPTSATFNDSTSLKIAATSGAPTSGSIGVAQYIEDFAKLAGKEVTYSAWVKADTSAARIFLYDGVSVFASAAHTGGGTWEYLSCTGTLSGSATSLSASCRICDAAWGNTSITSGEYMEFTEAQLELGDTATAFEYRHIEQERLLAGYPDSTDTTYGAKPALQYAREGRKNLIINGNPSISQRGDYTSAVGLNDAVYLLDRWQGVNSGIAGTVQQLTTSQPSGATFSNSTSIRVATALGGTGFMGQAQVVEDYARVAGSQVTFSAWVKSDNTSAKLIVFDGVSETHSTTHTGDDSWEQLTVTKTLSPSASQLSVYVVVCGATRSTNTTTSANDYVEFTEAQLELGDTATDFEYRSQGEELALCQRYYWQTADGLGIVIPMVSGAGNNNAFQLQFPVTMRTVPTLSHDLTDGNNVGTTPNSNQWAAHQINTGYGTKTGTAIFATQGTKEFLLLNEYNATYSIIDAIHIGANLGIYATAEL